MRIKQALTSRNIDNNNPTTESSKSLGDASIFTAVLNQKQAVIDSYSYEITELKKEIDAAGDKLEQEPNLDNFKKFRNLLSQMAKRVTGEAYRLEKTGGTPQNPRYYEVISVINTEADQLYKLIIHEQRNHIAIIAKVIGIKGLVVNLVT
jgi:uncharacterized protein